MKNGHPDREHAKGKERREMSPHAREDMRRGMEHLAEHHAEERREMDHGHNRERGMEGKR